MVTLKQATVAGLSLLLGAGGLVAGARGRLYRGPREEPPAWDPGVAREKVVAEARRLRGILYDPLQGMYGDLGGRLGLIVCMDVPVIAYRNAGASVRRLLEGAYAKDASPFSPRDGRPGNPFFHRRARNLFAYCKAACRLTVEPRPADVAFFSRGPAGDITHIALVSEAGAGGAVRLVEASRDYLYVTREVAFEDILRRGWVFRGFGDLLSSDAAKSAGAK